RLVVEELIARRAGGEHEVIAAGARERGVGARFQRGEVVRVERVQVGVRDVHAGNCATSPVDERQPSNPSAKMWSQVTLTVAAAVKSERTNSGLTASTSMSEEASL